MTNTDPFNAADSQEPKVQRIMLVADGEPQHGGLKPLSYSSEHRMLLDGFFGQQRERVIWEAQENANCCQHGTKTYVMTTGHGAVSVTAAPTLYNVPGQLSIVMDEHRAKYRQSFLSMLPLHEATVITVAVVYYASVSKKEFRNGVFQILADLCAEQQVSQKIKVHACMLGARHHPADRWLHFCEIYNGLINDESLILDDIRSRWLRRYNSIAPFFEWF